ncbi:HET-domain-containing protein [Hyaloscypha variabilis F]|uniref:HET-domain-containing protein n=1 Tax=Hyaloscypha variabilis (strain UAMH 11265 / GT02V1 / F) TaxID=1149755 RepID=A0A2J6QSL8_HYAVF|nr:HET-domain-containing protein [Hyaloscypha variabilis F]
MRLLKINNVNGDDVEFELVNREGKPNYAILSHTWGKDTDELSFEDMKNDEGCNKIGYQKMKKFLAKAWQAGLRYGWVDTCCIDKSSSAELSEAINSMFQWYKEAAYCCVYFSDLLGHPSKLLKQDLAVKLRPCRWFRRGWTLQELLAPSHLIFYSQDWQSIGDGEYLKDIISIITGIHAEALTNDPNKLGKFSIAQRMSWASERQTTRVEDMAYCLMGIFDVNMPLIYGEGNKAFTRLQEQIAKDSDD